MTQASQNCRKTNIYLSKVEFNKSTGSNFELTDAYIQFAPKSSKFKIKVGQFKTHNSMEEETSSRFTTTLERGAYTDAFGLDRRIGVSVNTSGDNYGFDLGLEDGPYLGQLDTLVLGADWWATKQARLGLNFFNVDAENGTSESGSGVLGRLSIDF